MTISSSVSAAALKCHVGPGCRLHSPTGIASARKELKLATESIQSARTIDEMMTAQTRLNKAQNQYDSTVEGRDALKEEIRSETDSVRKQVLQNRLEDAEERAAELEAEFAQQFNNKPVREETVVDSIHFPNKDTYDAPTWERTGDNRVGSKYAGYRNVREIKKDVLNDLREAQAKGHLPAGIKFSAKVEFASFSQSLTVTVKGLSDKALYAFDSSEGRHGYTAEAKKLEKRVQTITNAYNHTHSDNFDNYSTIYSGYVAIEDDRARRYRSDVAAVAKKKRSVAGFKASVKQELESGDAASFKAKHGLTMTSTSPDNFRFQRLEGTDLIAFERPSLSTPNRTIVEVYDFTGLSSASQLEDIFSSTPARAVLAKRKKNLVARKLA